MSNTQIQSQVQSVHVPKTLGHQYGPKSNQSTAKALGSDPALAQWYQEAYAYYQNVASGQSPQPDTASWNEFLTQMNWAYQQLNYATQGAQSFDFLDSGATSDAGQAADPFGGMLGTNGQWIHNNAEAQMGFLGGYTREVWSNEITYDVAPLSAQTKVIKTMDTSVQPPVEVIKIKTIDPATGTEDVVTIHDWEDADITIRAGDPSSVTGADALGITVEEFKENDNKPTVQQSSIAGEAHETKENYWIYEGRMGETIEFRPEPSGADSVEEHEIYGDARIVGRASDHYVVYQGIHGDRESEGYTVEVIHRDGSKDIYYVNKGGFEAEIIGNPAYITWADDTMSAEGIRSGEYEGVEADVPETYSEVFSLGAASGSSQSDDSSVDGDSPTRTEGDTRIFDSGESADIYTRNDGKTTEVYARNDVTLHASSNLEFWTIAWDQENARYVIQKWDEKPSFDSYGQNTLSDDHLKETIYVDGMVDQLTLDVDPSHVQFMGELAEEFDPHKPNTATDYGSKVSVVGGEEPNQTTQTSAVPLPPYPENVSAMVGSSDHASLGRQLAEEMELALHTDDWSGVQAMLSTVTNNGSGNDMVRHYLTALYRAMVGDSNITQNSRDLDMEGFKKVLQHIPTDVRRTLINYLYHEEDNERNGSEIWGNVQARQILVASITEQEFTETDNSADDE